MRINRLNFEEYLADYLNGNLDPFLAEELMIFLSDNPDIEKMWHEPEFQDHTLSASNFQYPDKESLKKNYSDVEAINDLNFDEFCIAEIEGILTPGDKKRLSEYIGLHPQKVSDHELFSHTLLRPDHSLQYTNKENLKRKVILKSQHTFSLYALRIAAAIAVFILMITIKPEKKSDFPEYANAIISSDINQGKSIPEKRMTDKKDKMAVNQVVEVKNYEKDKIPGADVYNPPVVLSLKTPIPAGLLAYPDITSQPVETALNMQSVILENPLPFTATVSEKTAAGEIPDLLGLLHKVDVLKTAEGLVKGFNHLTEANLKLNSTVNDEGKLSELVIKSESFVIASFNKN